MNSYKLFLLTIVLNVAMFTAPAAASEENTLEVSANAGILSSYIFRGLYQSDITANGGIDASYGPAYIGTWVADLDSGDGHEYDIYGGLDFNIGENHHVGIAYTAYRYTEDDEVDGFDDNYDEVNLYFGTSFDQLGVELEYTTGEADNLGAEESNYDFFAATFSYSDFYLTLGEFGISKDDEDEGEPNGGYFELGYGKSAYGLDFSVALVDTEEKLGSSGDSRIVFGVGRSFNILGGAEE